MRGSFLPAGLSGGFGSNAPGWGWRLKKMELLEQIAWAEITLGRRLTKGEKAKIAKGLK